VLAAVGREGHQLRVLAAEREPPGVERVLVHLVVRRVLEADGHDIVEAADGDEALQQLRRQRADVAILDFDMSGRDGLSRCRAMRADHELRDTALIVLSGDTLARPVLGAGAEALLRTPCRPAAVRDALARPVHARPARHAQG
jgi:CheY-like chemotaxis protein